MNRTASVLLLYWLWIPALSTAQGSSSPQPTAPTAQFELGNQCFSNHDYSAAMTWYRKAADQGSAAAQAKIGWLYENGLGVKQDYPEALTWYRKAAEQGNAMAENNIGWSYQNGHGVSRDYALAADWYRKAADQGNTNAEVNLGLLYENGHGVAQDFAAALRLYVAAANQGDAVAQNNAGVLYEKGLGVEKDYRMAMAWYYRAADQGYALAQDNLGLLYRNGLGVPQDYGKAATWFRKAAEAGNAKAQTSLAWLYANGLGVNQDNDEAMKWYKKAADQGNAAAYDGIAWFYQNGFGVKQDYAEALNWYRKAADQNDAAAQNDIGWFYQNGWGVKQDYAEAMNWYRKAAAQGNSRAKVNMEALSQIRSSIGDSKTANENTPSPATRLMAGGIRPPQAIYSPDPEYSDEARKNEVNGVMVLSLSVGDDGLPRDIRVVAPLGYGLDEKAVQAVKAWKFSPATKDGKPVAVQIMVEVHFRLYEHSYIGKVETVGDTPDGSLDSYLSQAITEASNCWRKSTEATSHAPSAKQGQVTVQMGIGQDGRVVNANVVSPSGDGVLDQDARTCSLAFKADKPLPASFALKDLLVSMQFLYNLGAAVSISPASAQVTTGNRAQFYFNLAGTLGTAANWSVRGAGCSGDACGTISTDGVYHAPDVLPEPHFVVVTGRLAGLNPLAASAIVALSAKPQAASAKVQ